MNDNELMKLTMRDILNTSFELENSLTESGGELTPEIESLLNFTVEQLKQKVDNYSSVHDRMLASAEVIRKKVEFLSKLADGYEAVGERIMERAKAVMLEFNLEEISGNEIRFKLQNSAAKVEIFDEHSLPKDFIQVVVSEKPDKMKIRNAVELGMEVPGAKLVKGKSLRVYAVKK